MGRSALITGITGQDGSYLTELLLARGYRVIGTLRPGGAGARPPGTLAGPELAEVDLLDPSQVADLVSQVRPREIYNLAARTSGEGMFDDPAAMGQLNGIAVTHLLEAIRKVDVGIRFCQASSSEMFGDATESPQSEATPLRPRSPYGAAKAYAHHMVGIFRRRYGLFAASAILYNHESPRRGPGFATRKITQAAARIKLGLATEVRLGNLEGRRDWGFAGDSVRAMWLMLQAQRPDDYVVATGETHSVRELCQLAFVHLGLDYRDHVLSDAAAFRAAEAVQLVGDAGKARRELGWAPEVSFPEIVRMMVNADLAAAGAMR